MKPSNTLFSLKNLTFIFIGAVIGFGATMLIKPMTTSVITEPRGICSTDGVTQITLSDAQTYADNYSGLFPDKIRGINVSMEQWRLINKTIEDLGLDLPGFSGFRLYFGIVDPSEPDGPFLSLAYPLNNDSVPKEVVINNLVNSIELGNELFSDPCPHFCD